MSRNDSPFVVIEEARRFDRRPLDRFDRIDFAMRALSIVGPREMRVAVYHRNRDLRIERGTDLEAGKLASWALLGIPADASRESIAHAVAELAGVADTPFVVDLLVLAGAPTESLNRPARNAERSSAVGKSSPTGGESWPGSNRADPPSARPMPRPPPWSSRARRERAASPANRRCAWSTTEPTWSVSAGFGSSPRAARAAARSAPGTFASSRTNRADASRLTPERSKATFRAMLRSALPLFLAIGCGSSAAPPAPVAPPPPAATGDPAAETSGDAPEISRSVGEAGGVVVLWPRIVLARGSAGPDAETRALAGRVQQRLAEVARRAAPGKPVDVRPEPERVCPRSGCKAASVGALLTRAGSGCAVLALVSAPGQSPQRIVPWFADVTLDADSVGFREHAEKVVRVRDQGACAALPDALSAGEAAIESAVKNALGG